MCGKIAAEAFRDRNPRVFGDVFLTKYLEIAQAASGQRTRDGHAVGFPGIHLPATRTNQRNSAASGLRRIITNLQPGDLEKSIERLRGAGIRET